MSEIDTYLQTGDWIEVKTPCEIASTLDASGTLDGLPFMPEMLEYCGRRFRVLRRAEKTCVEFPTRYWIREFRSNDVVLLDGLRCSGIDHDRCERSCMLFWKTAWLKRIGLGEPAASCGLGRQVLRSKMHTMAAPGQYFCQSTELAKATQPLTRRKIIMKCVSDVHSGSRGAFEMMGLILAPLWRKATEKIPRRRIVGTLKRTPVGDLKLQPGDLVEIRAESEIANTLDQQGRNRGLVCDTGMTRYCGGKYRVRSRLDRMISESTGKMRNMGSTVILEGLNCGCSNVLGGCPRQDFIYWREIWLERVDKDTDQPEAGFPAHQ